ncbi:MAG: hypothetical protein WD598_13510 [Acidimicrobiia bacterium]
MKPEGTRRWAFVGALIIGLGLALAPAIFQMFSRAPLGGDMITDFRPYMRPAVVAEYQGYIAELRAADVEIDEQLTPLLEDRFNLDEAQIGTQFAPFAAFAAQWATIDADMSDMLGKMDRNIDNYEAVAALPSFPLFPWFFVAPGLIIAGLAVWGLRKSSHASIHRPAVIALAVMGLGVIAAPAIFQMFSRAPKGAEMIDDFREFMNTPKLRTIQGYFVTIGGGEGSLRTAVLPALEAQGVSAATLESDLPDVQTFSEEWPTMFRRFASMIGTMQENIDNYAAVDALPPFGLFPWFFVAPGILVAGFAVAAGRPRRRDAPTVKSGA